MVPRWFVVLVTVSVATAGAALPPLGDPGPGQDAGDEPENATPLPGPGTYNGTLTPPGDADWYELSTPTMDPLCSEAIVRGSAHAQVTLSTTTGLQPGVTRSMEPGHVLELGQSAPSTRSFFLGLEPSPATAPASASAGTYQLAIRTLELGDSDGDAGTGEDAGDTREDGIWTEGPCIDGELSSPTDSDVYLFDASEGEHVALSLADASRDSVFVNLTAPSGALLAKVDAGELRDVSLNETGQWSIRVDLPGQTTAKTASYLVGLTVNGPEPQPCKPGCFAHGG